MVKKKNYVNNADLTAAIVQYQKLCRKNTKLSIPEPSMPKYIGECILSICNRLTKGFGFDFGGYCVDEETTILSQRGWLSYKEITTNDIVLSIDPITQQLIWSTIHDLYIGTYNGLMFKLDGSTIDALVNPGHKFLTAEHGLVKVEDLLVKDHLVTMGKPIENNIQIYSDDFVELVGWFVTEGNVSKYQRKSRQPGTSYYIKIYQSETANPSKCDRIKRCIEKYTKEKVSHKKGSGVFSFSKKYTQAIINVALDKNENKVLSYDFILNLSQRQKILLIQTMIAGDGSLGGRNKEIPQYFQKNKEHIDSFLFLCTLAGYTTCTTYREWKTAFNERTNGYLVTLTNKKMCYLERVNFHGGKRNGGGNWYNKKHHPTVLYKGVVWCPQTDYGTIVCRRGQRIWTGGQTYHDEMINDAVERCIYAVRKFNAKKASAGAFSYLTTVAINAKKKRIKDEKKQNYIKHKHFQYLNLQSPYETISPNELSDKVIGEFEDKAAAKKALTLQNKPSKIAAQRKAKKK